MQLLLDTMAEIMRILYVKVQKRCQKNVLRLHNQIFLHAATCEEVIGKPIILTEKKLYGRYLQSLVCHALIQHHITTTHLLQVSQHTTTKAPFKHFASTSLATSSRWPGEIITPELIRMQTEMKQGEISWWSAIQD